MECRDLEYHSIRDRVYLEVSGSFHLVCCIHMLLYEGRLRCSSREIEVLLGEVAI